MTWGNIEYIYKRNGICFKKSKWKYCPYWTARHSKKSGQVTTFRCLLFGENKTGDGSVSECDIRYGRTYEGPP